jgi:rhamnose transport system permease protein
MTARPQSGASSLRQRERSVALAILALAAVLGIAAPSYFAAGNLRDMFLANLPVLVTAIGMTLIVLTGEIDISVGSLFAVASVAAGIVAKTGLPMPFVIVVTCAVGAAVGASSGALVAYLGLPSIVVTLAMMIALRDALRWATQGAWIQDLPAGFQWFGGSQRAFPVIAGTLVLGLLALTGWSLRHLRAGRAVYATGSNPDAARLAGLSVARIKLAVFAIAGALTGLAALVNAVRFNQIPSNTGLGLEMQVIAAVVVGGTVIRGGRGSLTGTVLGVVLLGTIGPALTFLGVNAYWERAIQGVIILVAVSDLAVERFVHRGARSRASAA